MKKKAFNLHHLNGKVKNKTSFLQTILLVALCVTFCTLLFTDLSPTKSYEPAALNKIYKQTQEKISQGLVLSCSEFQLGFQDRTRSYEVFLSPFTKNQNDVHYHWVERIQSIVIKVSFRNLFALQSFQAMEEYLFLDLRRLLI